MNKKGFTLIELLLVVMIIGLMLAVILPRGLRATTDAKYNLVRQNCAELAAYGNDWIEQQILAQDEDSTSSRSDYLKSLVEINGSIPPNDDGTWIAGGSAGVGNERSNWNLNATNGFNPIVGRKMNGVNNSEPETAVEGIIEPSKLPRNPFNGANIFNSANAPSVNGKVPPIPGSIACSVAPDSSTGGSFDYYAFIFQGTDSTQSNVTLIFADFHGGMKSHDLAGLREGVFFTKVRQ